MGLRQTRLLRRMFSYARRPNAAGFYTPKPQEMRGKMTDAPFAPYCKMPRGLL